jgi:hypothetical protein
MLTNIYRFMRNIRFSHDKIKNMSSFVFFIALIRIIAVLPAIFVNIDEGTLISPDGSNYYVSNFERDYWYLVSNLLLLLIAFVYSLLLIVRISSFFDVIVSL